mgnify:CR=1 FL=1
MIEYMVTHIKSGESDGPFATYKEAKAHYDSHDEEWQLAHYIEEVNEDDLQDNEEYWHVNPTKNDEEE